MLAINSTNQREVLDKNKMELYQLIGAGYNDIQEGKTSTIDEVREKLIQIRKERDKDCIC